MTAGRQSSTRRRVIIIGAGPAGLAAADAALRRAAAIVLIDSAPRLGGQFWRHPSPTLDADESLQHNWSRFTDLRSSIRDNPAAEVITEGQVWAIDREPGRRTPRIQLATGPVDGPGRELSSLTGDAVVLATGAHDRTLPFPGWDLPGVVTGGAAQAIAKADRISVGGRDRARVVVAGAGPFLLPVATSLAAVGARVLGVYEAATIRRMSRGWLPRAPWLAGKSPELTGYLARLARHRIPYHPGHAVLRADGDDRVRRITIARVDDDWRPVAGTERQLEVDAVCVSHGFTPRVELPIAAGCRLTPERFVQVDAGQRTSVDDVYAAGEITRIGGADAALVEGGIAGHLAAGGAINDAELGGLFAAKRRLDRLADSVDDAHGIGTGWTDWLTDETLICRCEEVTNGRVRSALEATGSRGLRAVKLSTRAGLGPCQGRICGRTLEQLISAGGPLTDDAVIDRRPIATPIRFGELARLTDDQEIDNQGSDQ
ncbi:FAD/NAD(P)-dependent oxidoreductase [Microlunatus soli]|uniref:Thioredoxin reductase n=1 Tax=Microlunatus soli TaxID=630515 RepID=A0A1H1SIL1_9ACTN|nr:NAD(P)/FAD-dependent oxidoreductase [Microlunatus soli]SDS47723.1 Thioredoxin reductase [Microlunatus soli]